jgi:hypothetical protein
MLASEAGLPLSPKIHTARSHFPVFRPIFGVDVMKFTHPSRDDDVQAVVREALYRVLKEAWESAGHSWTGAIREDRGDGILLIAPPDEPLITLIDPLLESIRARLRRHNKLSSKAAAIRLRAALHAGLVRQDEHGVVGTAVNHLFRLLDTPQLRHALDEPGVDLAFIASQQVYEHAISSGYGDIDPAAYLPVDVQVKETSAWGWITIPTSSRRPQFPATQQRDGLLVCRRLCLVT